MAARLNFRGYTALTFMVREMGHALLRYGAGLFLACTAAVSASAQDAPLKIRLTTMSSPDSPISLSIEHFKQRVEQESQGSIQVEIFFSSKLHSDQDAIAAIGTGAVEMGAVSLVRYAAKVPIAEAFQLPFLFNTEALGSAAMGRISPIRAVIDKEIAAKTGTQVLWWIPLGRTVSLTRGLPVADPAAISGKTVHTISHTSGSAVKLCGGQPVDTETSLQAQTGGMQKADITTGGIVSVVDRKLWQSMDTLTRTNQSSMQAVVTINAALWRNLSAEKRIIIAAAARMADEEARGIMVYLETTAYRMLAEEHGLKIVDLTDEQLRLWRICSSDTLYEFMEKSGASGQQLMVAYGRMRATSARATRMESRDFQKALPVKAAPQPAPPPEIGLMRAKAAPAKTATH